MNLIHKVSFHSRELFKFILNPSIVVDYIYLKFHGVDTKLGYVKLMGWPIIQKAKGSKIILHKGVTLVSKSKYNIAGINHPVIIATLAENAIIEIGAVGISGSTLCAVEGIFIGDDSGLGANSNIYDTDFHCLNDVDRKFQSDIRQAPYKAVRIGKNVWISSNATVLKGVTIGDGAVIGAGSIVTKDVKPKIVVAGNPAKPIKTLT
ncbi:acyltransferase [Pontibacter sp. CAU 1760]